MKIKNLAVTTDFSPEAAKVYPAAARLAEKFGARVVLVHRAEPFPGAFLLSSPGGPLPLTWDSSLIRIRERLEEEARHDGFAGVQVEPRLLTNGSRRGAVERFVSEEAIDLVVASSHGRTGIGAALLGSFTRELLEYLTVPLLTYRRPDPSKDPFRPREVLVAFDFSENSRSVFGAIRLLHKAYRPRFTFLHAIEPVPALIYARSGRGIADSLFEATEEAARRAQEEFSEKIREELGGLDLHLAIRKGHADRAVTRAACESQADLVLLSTHGWTGLKRFIVGSVAERIVRRAPCSVLTVRPEVIVEGDSFGSEWEGST